MEAVVGAAWTAVCWVAAACVWVGAADVAALDAVAVLDAVAALDVALDVALDAAGDVVSDALPDALPAACRLGLATATLTRATPVTPATASPIVAALARRSPVDRLAMAYSLVMSVIQVVGTLHTLPDGPDRLLNAA